MSLNPGRPAWVEDAIELYRSGLSGGAVAERLGIPESTVFYRLRTIPGLLRPPVNPWVEPPWAEAAEQFYRAGSSIARTSEQLTAAGHSDASTGRVLRVLITRGVPIRHPRDAAQRNLAAGAHLVGRRKPTGDLSARTLMDYQRRWRRFVRWCAEHDRSALPATEDALRGFIAHMAGKGHPSTYVTGHLNAIRFHHEHADVPLSPEVTLPALVPRDDDGAPAAVTRHREDRRLPAAGENANEATRADHERRWASFTRWCAQNDLPSELPVEEQALAAYLRDMHEKGYSPGYINHQVTAIRARHLRAGLPFAARLNNNTGATPLAGLQIGAAA